MCEINNSNNIKTSKIIDNKVIIKKLKDGQVDIPAIVPIKKDLWLIVIM